MLPETWYYNLKVPKVNNERATEASHHNGLTTIIIKLYHLQTLGVSSRHVLGDPPPLLSHCGVGLHADVAGKDLSCRQQRQHGFRHNHLD